MQGEAIRLNSIGHTDATGLEDSNLKLYKASAAVLKDALVSIYEISANRLKTDGKGTSTTRGVFQLAVSPLQKTRPLTNNYMKVK